MTTRRALLLTGLGFASAPTWARITDLGDAINKAGAQRMLSQRMGKAWLGLALPELDARARKVMDVSIERFERQLGELQAFAPTSEIASSYQRLATQFTAYRTLLAETPAKARVNELLQRSGEVLATAHLATGQLQAQSRAGAAKLVNLSGRQRMLSQRLALLFMADQQGADPQLVRAETAKARTEFEAAMKTLTQAPETTPPIRDNLALAQNQWVFLQAALAGTTQGAHAAGEVFVASENLLAVMETVTGQFARQLT